MKNPFPGMNPFIETYHWPDFHLSLIAELKRQIAPKLPARYDVMAELHVKQRELGIAVTQYRPDTGISDLPEGTVNDSGAMDDRTTSPTLILTEPKWAQRYLRIVDREGGRLVTAIEVLSPSNKHGTGLTAYRAKRSEYHQSDVNLLELDLLRDGTIPNWEKDWPSATYRVQLHHAGEQRFYLYNVGLDDKLPTLPLPLAAGDNELVLNLQSALEEVIKFTRYRIDYTETRLKPPLTQTERAAFKRAMSGTE